MQCEGKFSLPLEFETITWIRGWVSLQMQTQMQTYFQLLLVSTHETRARKTGCSCRLGRSLILYVRVELKNSPAQLKVGEMQNGVGTHSSFSKCSDYNLIQTGKMFTSFF